MKKHMRYYNWKVHSLAILLLVLGFTLFEQSIASADGSVILHTAEGCYNTESYGVPLYGDGEGSVVVDVPGPVVDSFIQWVGTDDTTPPEEGESTLIISNGMSSEEVPGNRLEGDAGLVANPQWYAWYADIGPNGAGLVTEPGTTTLFISGWDGVTERTNGATVNVIYSTGDCETPSTVVLRSGVDFYYYDRPGEEITDLLIYEFEPAATEQVASVRFSHAGTEQPQQTCRGGAIWMLAGSGTPPDPAAVDLLDIAPNGRGFGINGGVEIVNDPFTGPTLPCTPTVNPTPDEPYEAGHPYPGGASDAPYRALAISPEEGGNVGPEWGILRVDVTVPAGVTWIAFQLESEADQNGESGAWAGTGALIVPAPQLVVLKANDANQDNQFSDEEQAPSFDSTVVFEVVISNPTLWPLTITRIADDIHGADMDLTTASDLEPACADILGTIIAPDQSVVCYFDGRVQLDVGESEVNTVTVEAVDEAGNQVSDADTSTVLPPEPLPAVDMSKVLDRTGAAEDGIVVVGEVLTFTIQVTNTGDTPLTVVPLRDTYDATYLSFLRATPAPDDSTTPGTLIWDDLTGAGSLAPSASIAVQVTFTALASTDALPDRQTINVAIVDGASDGVTTLPPVEDDAPIRITDPNVDVAKTATDPADGVVALNELVTFTIAITNTGDTRLDVIPVRDLFEPQDLEYVHSSLTTEPEISDGELFWSDVTTELGDLEPGAATSFLITFRFINADVSATTNTVVLTNVIDEHGDQPGEPEGQADSSTVVRSPTAITLIRFIARPITGNIELHWVTGSEINTLGFHLWRSTDSVRVNAERVTDRLIGAQGSAAGGPFTYYYVDTSAEVDGRYYYWLQEIELDGETIHYGPAIYQGTSSEPSTGAGKIFVPFVGN